MTYNKYVFYIYAPAYTPLSSGIRLLYILCDSLNKIGFESYVTASNVANEFIAPTLTSEIIKEHSTAGRLQVAIYPEIMLDNPLQCKKVIRWLLNKPNFFTQNWLGDFDEDDFIVHHDESFRPAWIKSNFQHIPHIDRSIFNSEKTSLERSGVILYENRHVINKEYVAKFNEVSYISSRKPMSPLDCSILYKKSSALIVAERTAACVEAALCGCPTVFLDNDKFDSSYIFEGYWKISSFKEYSSNINELNRGNAEILEKLYDEEVEVEKVNLQLLIKKAINHFENIPEKMPEDVPSILLENCNNLIKAKKYKDAAIILERIFHFSQVPNKAYFLYYKICRDINDYAGAEYAQNYLYKKILSYGDNKIFEKIFNFNDNGNFFDVSVVKPKY